jgi:spore coat protein CotH
MVDPEDPYTMPWLLSFDEFAKGQLFEHRAEVAIRPAMMSPTYLNETLAMEMIRAAGQPIVRYSYAGYRLNGGEPKLRLVLETPSAAYADEHFPHEGMIYKALVTGSFAYVGDDPLAYADSFKQITRTNQQDLAPVIELIKFVEQSNDAEFDAHLGEYIEIDALAAYCAIHSLIDNFDDMSGPGANYYLWYDLSTEEFTVLSWDLNLAFQSGEMGAIETVPGGPTEQGGGGGPKIFGPGGATQPGEDLEPVTRSESDGPVFRVGGGPGGEMEFGSPLKERFLKSAAFKETYRSAYAAAFDAIYGSGAAMTRLTELAAFVASTGLAEHSAIDGDISRLQTAIEERVAAGPQPPEQPQTP